MFKNLVDLITILKVKRMCKVLKNFVGIDISKLFFDVATIQVSHPDQVVHQRFEQSLKGFSDMRQWLKNQGILPDEQTLFCMEYTGIYNTTLAHYLCNAKAMLWIEMGIRIKKSDGFQRGSNDKTDAIKIARYAFRHHDKMKLWSPTDEHLSKIKNLIAQRDRIVDSISKLTVPVSELKQIGCLKEAKQMEALQKTAVKNLQKAKHNIEAAIMKIVNEHEEFSNKVQRVKSIKGIGDITAVTFLVYTKGFTCFENAKELSCYCGVVPFIKKQSGTSVKSRPRVSPFANKKLKCLLHLCALSAIKFDSELKAYYQRKVLEGKNKMSVINAVRNKLVLRMFAVLRDNRNFVEKCEKLCA